MMNHQAASSTECPTVKSPWLRWMVALCGPERRRQRLGRGLLQHDGATALRAHGVVFVEDASVLGDRIERAAERGPRLAVDRVRVGGGDDVGAGGVHGGVDGEGGRVHRPAALDDLAGVAHQDQVGDADVAEAHAEGIDPEVVGQLGIASRDVAGDALGEAEAAEQPQRAGQPLLAVQALLFQVVELGAGRQLRRSASVPGWPVSERARAMAPKLTSAPMTYPTAVTPGHRRADRERVGSVTDLPRMGEWSPENAGGKWVKGSTGPALGSVFEGTNKNGFRRWTTSVTVIGCEPNKLFEFAVTSGPLAVATGVTNSPKRTAAVESPSPGWISASVGSPSSPESRVTTVRACREGDGADLGQPGGRAGDGPR